jgi:transposase InsO family protein
MSREILIVLPCKLAGSKKIGAGSDAGSQLTSIRYGERLAEIGAAPSIGTVGDSYDNALAETVNGYYTTELVRGPARRGPWRTAGDLELATLGWVYWHNTQRLHGYLGDVLPAEFEQVFYTGQTTSDQLVRIKLREAPTNP